MRRLAVLVVLAALAVSLMGASPASADSLRRECAESGGTFYPRYNGHPGVLACEEFAFYEQIEYGNGTYCSTVHRVWGVNRRHPYHTEFDGLVEKSLTPGPCPTA